MSLSVRRATSADIDTLTSLLTELDSFHQLLDKLQIRQGTPPSASREQLSAGLADEAMRVLVCELNGDIVGYGRMEIKNSKGNRIFRPMRLGILHEVVIAENSRNLGRGTALMEALHEEAVGAGVERIQLEHYAENASARLLYEKLGYSVMRFVCVKDFQSPSGDA